MMAYFDYLQRLLSPLWVYDLSEESISGASLAAFGDALDEIWDELQATLRDAFPQNAGEAAIGQWEQIAPTHPRPTALAQRQAAVTWLLSHKGAGCCSAADAVQALALCGLEAEVSNDANKAEITVRLSTQDLSAEELSQTRILVRKLIPAHLQITVQEI